MGEGKIKEIDSALVRMVALDFQPMSIVQDEGFIQYSKTLNQDYTLPSRKTLSDVLIQETFTSIKAQLSSMLKEINHLT